MHGAIATIPQSNKRWNFQGSHKIGSHKQYAARSVIFHQLYHIKTFSFVIKKDNTIEDK